ncbi:hypothetical protein LRAMOSA07708 [Lichtheimia ramosa]|uniref:Receptor L-domain domain-containing protein n=1 Tax=Lichtheimia ramosa TaxID=688394 RepID=A0A077WDF8_9FUNG|nr:hypothetical protein LRAMOSA07708 [Lichtheimia ramosa]
MFNIHFTTTIANSQENIAAQKPQTSTSDVCSTDITGSGQGDLDAIKGCKTYKGTITMEKPPVDQLTLEGVESIQGNLILRGSDTLTSFRAPQLKSVKGELSISQHTRLERLDLGALTEVQSLTLSVLPVLEKIDFTAGLSQVDDLRIEDTRASNIGGLKLDKLHSFALTENTLMKKFELSAKEITGRLYVVGNNNEMEFDASQLASVQDATFRNLAKINLSGLSHVQSDISFHQNGFSDLHIDNVEDIGGTLAIANNDHLTETSFKKLSLINGALSIGNNTQLQSISGFPSLNAIHGTVDLAGSFDKYEFPQLQDVRGGMRIQTTSSSFNCPELEQKFKKSSVVKGSIWGCKSNMDANNMDPTIGQGGGAGGAGGALGSMPKKQKTHNNSSNKSNNDPTSDAASISVRGSFVALAAGLLGSLAM